MTIRFVSALIFGVLLPLFVFAEPELQATAPKQYVVKAGDSLWEIAGRYLKNPWAWEALWRANPHINNPDNLYVGDVITLTLYDGNPALAVGTGGVVKLSPRVREFPLKDPVPTLPIKKVEHFLLHSRIVNREDMLTAPYIVAIGSESVTGSKGSTIYVRGLKKDPVQAYAIYRSGEPYVDPVTEKELGFPMLRVGIAQISAHGDPAVLKIDESFMEVRVGDKLLPAYDYIFTNDFFPRAPAFPVEGRIVGLLGEPTRHIGEYRSIAINYGEKCGLAVGDVLAIYRPGDLIVDKFASGKKKEEIRLPDEYIGQIMVYRVFENVSIALILDTVRPVFIGDKIKNPVPLA